MTASASRRSLSRRTDRTTSPSERMNRPSTSWTRVRSRDCKRLRKRSSRKPHPRNRLAERHSASIEEVFAQAGGIVGEVVCLAVVLARDAQNGEFQAARQLAAYPVQGIELGTPTGILARHLANDYIGI